MRMWMLPPTMLCKQHLLGEHHELHSIAGMFRNQRRINNFINANCFEPESLVFRHEVLVDEMLRRGMNHKTPLEHDYDLSYLPDDQRYYVIDKHKSMIDLLARCSKCMERYSWLIGGVHYVEPDEAHLALTSSFFQHIACRV